MTGRLAGGLEVRSARASDAPAVAEVKRAAAVRAYGSFADGHHLTGWLAKRADVPFIADRIRASEAGVGCYLVATRHDDDDGGNDGAGTGDDPRSGVVGAGLVRAEPGGDGEVAGYLADVYVDPPGRGVGSTLVRALLAYADAQGWPRVRCFVLAGNTAAERFFARHGFVECARQPNQELPGQLIEMVRHRPTA